MKYNNAIKRVLCVLMLVVIAVLVPASHVQAKTTYDFDATVLSGYGQKVYAGYGAPFNIKIENKSNTNFTGYIQMIVPGFSNNNTMYEEEIALGVGEVKNIQIVAGIMVPSEFVNIRMANKKHKVVWSELERINVSKDMKEIKIGVLSDDFSALAYMDRLHFISDDSKYTTLYELKAADFPTDYLALDMLDCILISDFSTDLLTKEQINALNIWIQKGGLLMVGTGSTANKTLSGLKGNVLNENVASIESRETTLGLKNENYSYLQSIISNSSGYSNGNNYYNMFDDGYYCDFYDYEDMSRDWDGDGYSDGDYDHDGFTDAIFNFGGEDDGFGSYYDAYGNKIDPSYLYLFDQNAFSKNSTTGEYHYKYYDERYGFVDEDVMDDIIDINGITQNELELFESYGYYEYCNLYGFDPKWYIYEASKGTITDDNALNAQFEQIFGNDYREFLDHFLYQYLQYYFYGTVTLPDLTKNVGTTISNNYDYINIDCTGIDEKVNRITDEILYGDTKGEDFVLAKTIQSGDGKIAVFAIDFTKNPLPRCPYSGEFVRNFIERTIGNEFITEAGNYENKITNSYYFTSSSASGVDELENANSSAPVPPILLYVIVAGLYFIGILVVYLVLLKKNKTWNLWKIYPIAAIATAILIFCVGFSTRVIRLNVNVITLLFPGEVTTKETDYICAIIPKAKDYIINFSNEVDVDRTFASGYNSLYLNDIEYDTYEVKYTSGYAHSQSMITNKVALEKQTYKAEASFPTQGGIEITFLSDPTIGGKGAKNLKVTNNYSTVLQDVMVQIYNSNDGYEEYYLNSLKPGENKVVNTGRYIDPSSKTGYYSASYYKNRTHLASDYEKNKNSEIILGLLFGNLYKGFNNTVKRKAVCKYIESSGNTADDNHVLVVAFPKSDLGVEVVDSKKCKFSRSQAIIVREDFANIAVDH